MSDNSNVRKINRIDESLQMLRFVLLASSAHSLRVWNLVSDLPVQHSNGYSTIPLCTLKGHGNEVNCVAQMADGRVVSGSDDTTLRVWDVAAEECVQIMDVQAKRNKLYK